MKTIVRLGICIAATLPGASHAQSFEIRYAVPGMALSVDVQMDSCAAILKSNAQSRSGIYDLALRDGVATQGYCDMGTDGGG